MSDWFTERAKQHLRDNGYVVIPRERHVVLTTQTILQREVPESYVEHVFDTMARRLGATIVEEGACIKEDETFDDPVTGKERVLRLVVGVIKTKPRGVRSEYASAQGVPRVP